MKEEVIKIEDIVYALRKRWKLIIIITLACTILSAILSFFVIKPKYEAKTKVFIGKEEAGNNKEYSNNDVVMYQKLMKTYAEILKTTDLIDKALGQADLDLKTSEILENLTVVPSADTQILEIKYTSTNKNQCIEVVEAITKEFITESKDLIPNGNIKIIQKAELPKNPVSPNKTLNILIAFLLGLMISIGLVFLLEYLDNTFKTSEELEKFLGIPVIGIIPDGIGEGDK